MKLKHTLSKTTYNMGVQCRKQLFMQKHHSRLLVTPQGDMVFRGQGHGRPVVKEAYSQHELQIMSSGQRVGLLARLLFDGGVDCSPKTHFDYSESILKTQKLMRLKMPVLYEAAFEFEEVMVAVDILVRDTEGGWHMYEVKSSTSVKKEHLEDAALQCSVLEGTGLTLSSVNIIHLDKDYVRMGELDVKKLFKIVNIESEVRSRLDAVSLKVQEFKSDLAAPIVPEVDVGPHCSAPYTCKFRSNCFSQKQLPDTFSIMDLKYGPGRKQWELMQLGVVSTLQIPSDYPLSPKQWIQVSCDKSSSLKYCDKDALKSFLATLRYPLAFMDFETISSGIPLCNNTRPYEQICFQYSLHLQTEEGAVLHHKDFLANETAWCGGEEPQKSFIRALIHDLGEDGDHREPETGSILVYNKSFEESRLKAIAEKHPDARAAISRIRTRLVDLAHPFKNMHVYRSAMRGSYSLKRVLPAMVPGMTGAYSDLPIGAGGQASGTFLQLVEAALKEQGLGKYDMQLPHVHKGLLESRLKLRSDLVKYCTLDTLAMARILEELLVIANENEK